MERRDDIDGIVSVLQTYFNGLYHADSQQLALVFHADARYVNTAKDDYVNYSRSEYFEVVDRRQSPASKNELRADKIMSIAFGGENMAFAQVQMSMMGRDYTDFLTLILAQGRWQIIAKVFDYKPQT